MEDREYEDLETRALEVVRVLNGLKDEIEQYKDAKLNTKKSLKALEKLVSAVSEAANELSRTAKQVEESDYVALCEGLDARGRELEDSCSVLTQKVAEVPKLLVASLAMHDEAQEKAYASYLASLEERDKGLQQRIAALEEVVGRIDRNTQKGFGKERG